ncbi:uncharacterized protein LOC131659713 [Vicia villosa]|uniref:uncharacterized protein LOC131659713 n=1 Tax=Vicia villosa TaxID=3911 RepID=UPI00273B4C17|nr:uncharacterized protein LOC131659713 [Vicia villosa]
MKTVSWNCRGLGSPRAVRGLARLLKTENPQLVFLMETRLKKDEMTKLKLKFNFSFDLIVDCRGSGRERSGGLCLWWNEGTDISIQSSSPNHIAGFCQQEDDDEPWFFAGVYGYPDEARKKDTWKLIQAINTESGSNIVFFGDLNDILYDSDKMGGNMRSDTQMNWGRSTMSVCDLQKVCFEGYPFTWTNGRVGDQNIQCRLDRSLCSTSFIHNFPLTKVHHLERFGSDHAALRILIQKEADNDRRRYLFRFEEAWSKEKSCGNFVSHLWKRDPGNFQQQLRSI